MLWTTRIGSVAFVADIRDDVVVVGSGGGRSVHLDIYTGDFRWP